MNARSFQTLPSRPIDIRVGTISGIDPAPAGMVQLRIDFGPVLGSRRAGVRRDSLSGLAEVLGARICAVIDPQLRFAPSAGALPLAMPDARGHMVLISPDATLHDGARPF